jgi:Ca2+-binding RTX toxin-like protein
VRVTRRAWIVPLVGVLLLMVGIPPSTADHGTRTIVGPLQPLGDSAKIVPSDLGSTGRVSSDMAFWGDRVYQGNWHGFRIVDVSNPAVPMEVLDYEGCGPETTGQGDVVVWGTEGSATASLLVWARNSGANATSTCDGDLEGLGFEGIHIFDITNEADPDRITSVLTDDGTHTLTAVPDTANNRLLIYSNPSSGNGFDVIEIPIANPAGASLLRHEAAAGSCHDISVFLGDVNRTICAGGSGTTVYSMDAADGGSLVNPRELYAFPGDGVSLAHSASFTWDGERFVIGHEPGGGTGANCDDNNRELERTLFMYDTDTGELLGTWNFAQQTPTENCTTHNFNFIPALNGKDILVSGHYQAGTWIVDWTNPANAQTIASADPPPLDPNVLVTGGAWSSYWYDGFVYESEITKGLHVFGIGIPEAQPGGFRPEAFSNPQTQLERIPGAAQPAPKCKGKNATVVGTVDDDTLAGTSGKDVIVGLNGNDRINGKGGRDVVCAGGGNDKVNGKGGNDKLFGQAGNDNLNGGAGRDRCVGGGGTDKGRKCEKEKSIES